MSISSRAALVAVLVAFAVVLAPVAIAFLLGQPAAIGDLVGYWQVASSVTAAAIAAGVSFYAIFQVKLAQDQVTVAQESLEEGRRGRQEQQESAVRSVLWTLFRELSHNRLVALNHEGYLRIDESKLPGPLGHLSWSDYDRVSAGPLWALPVSVLKIQPAIAKAYDATRVLNSRIRPLDWDEIIGAGIVSVLQAPFKRTRTLVAFALYFVAKALHARWGLNRSGEIRHTRILIERAMDLIHKEIEGAPLTWADFDRDLPPGVEWKGKR